ncbi:hypothetical protein SRABI27_03753 [Pedobacter sp. Bi27]|uniref:hypothetical protein n=1 Tax=Pedobacter sp. Bi27 TaxID=2822351 RepID=UPI001D32AD7F|nr:hypothetical protein [Pedobacter sp. Bi27]CAH0280232.1 hypothetical protein SRABI27_03753 [Pedobacter sp. Bi27]
MASLIIGDAHNITQLLPERNFIRSRIGNSAVFGFNSKSFRGNYQQSGEFRLKFGLFSKRYEYNPAGTKKEMLDYFNGYTLTYGFGSTGEFGSEVARERVRLIKGEIRSNYDLLDHRYEVFGFCQLHGSMSSV